MKIVILIIIANVAVAEYLTIEIDVWKNKAVKIFVKKIAILSIIRMLYDSAPEFSFTNRYFNYWRYHHSTE